MALFSEYLGDTRELIRDPHVDPALRQLTGRHQAVRDAVRRTPGALALVDLLRQAANRLAYRVCDEGGTPGVRVAIGCQGGRHRSVVLADVVGVVLHRDGFEVRVTHRDIDKPVVQR